MFAVAACAMGDIPRVGQDASVRHDAHVVRDDGANAQQDAASFADAAPPPDAGGAACIINSDCAAATDCCWFFTCKRGLRSGENFCFPN
jgi:hypothetical protein